MAIRREYKKYYGPAWRRYRLALIAAHGSRCSVCRAHVARYLNAAHVSHDPRSSDVALMCASCHARHDARQAYAVRRRNEARRTGQLWLWPEVAASPDPAWLAGRPGQAEDTRQGGLFG